MAFKRQSHSAGSIDQLFSRDNKQRDSPCIGIFGAGGAGKTRLCATAAEWATEHGTVPGWLIMDRKTRRTVADVAEQLGFEPPYMNTKDFIERSEALEIATNSKVEKTMEIYTQVFQRVLEHVTVLGADPNINPIIFETGTQLWDWIAYSHFGRKQDVGKSRVWGPPKQDWSDLFQALDHKTVLVTFWERDDYKDDKRTGFTKADGPPHLSYTTTSIVRLTDDRARKLGKDETYIDRFALDVLECQENKGIEGTNGVLVGESITYTNLISILRPEES